MATPTTRRACIVTFLLGLSAALGTVSGAGRGSLPLSSRFALPKEIQRATVETLFATVQHVNGELEVSFADSLQATLKDDAIAWAEFSPQSKTASNFGRLRLESSGKFADDVQMKAIGYLEGFITAEPIWQHWLNMQWYLSGNTNKIEKVNAWLQTQREWMAEQIAAHPAGVDSFWDMQALIWKQLEGMVEGYASRIKHDDKLDASIKVLDMADLWLLNSFGDMDDLLVMMDQDWLNTDDSNQAKPRTAPGPVLHPHWNEMSPGQARAHIAKSGHCSALIKVTNDLSDILMGHTTWWSYSSLMRLYKHVITNLANPAVAAQKLSFSSYPGLVHSMDDFMIASSGLVMMETSNDVFDLSLYRLSTNHGAMSWQRARAASMLAADGMMWAEMIQRHNSGTYNNQYMIVNLGRFKPGQQLQPGLLTVVETVPGGAYAADTTQELERGYWPSYNIPYFSEVYNKTGYPDLQAHFRARGGDYVGLATGLSYQVAPRAKIFRRDSGTVNDLWDLKKILRSNGWRDNTKNSDPFSPSPWEAICARGDLDPESPAASGCYDAKVTSYSLATRMQAEVINGPAWDGDGSDNGHSAFSWRDWKGVSHIGMISQYKTYFELQSP